MEELDNHFKQTSSSITDIRSELECYMDDSYVDKEYEKHGEKVLEIWKLRNEFGLADLNYIHAYRMGQIINISNPDEYSNLSNQLYGQSAQQVYLEVYKSRNIKELRNSFLC